MDYVINGSNPLLAFNFYEGIIERLSEGNENETYICMYEYEYEHIIQWINHYLQMNGYHDVKYEKLEHGSTNKAVFLDNMTTYRFYKILND